MCHPVGLGQLALGAPARSPSPGELAELGAHLVRERPSVERQLRSRLPRRLGDRFSVDLVDEVASAWIAEMFRRFAKRSHEHLALTVADWARVVWNNALASAIREVDRTLSAPVRLPKKDTGSAAPGLQCRDDDLVELPLAAHRGARVAMLLIPDAVAEVLSEPSTSEPWRRRVRRRAAAVAALRQLIEAEL
jgi:hypothetical protein